MIRVLRLALLLARLVVRQSEAQQTLPWHLRLLLHIWPFSARRLSGEKLAAMLEAEGPVFIKFGQFLSTRPDLLPTEIAAPLARLRDDCEPLPLGVAEKLVHKELGVSVETVFDEFTAQPMAAASLAQVHGVRLNGKEMVVKLLRPGIEKRVEKDLKLLQTAAVLAQRRFGAHWRLPEIIANYARTVRDECDLRLEAARTSKMRDNAQKHGLLCIPKVHWPLVTARLMVMERMYALPVTDVEGLRAAGIDLKELAQRGVRIFFTQLFDDNFFHGDMHPGNIMVLPEPTDEPVYVAVDCAITGELDAGELLMLGRMLRALLARDFRRVAVLLCRAGWVQQETVVSDLELAVRAACEPLLEQPLAQVRFSELLLYLLGSARRFGLIVQPSLALLIKTLVNIEGMGRQLYPELDFWGIANDMLSDWSRRQLSPAAVMERSRARLERVWPDLERLPALLLQRLESPPAPPPASQHDIKRASNKSRIGLGIALGIALGIIAMIVLKVMFGR